MVVTGGGGIHYLDHAVTENFFLEPGLNFTLLRRGSSADETGVREKNSIKLTLSFQGIV